MSKPWLNVLLKTGVLFLTAALSAPTRVQARAETPQTPTIAEKTAGAQKLPGPRLARMTTGMAGTDFSGEYHVTKDLLRRL